MRRILLVGVILLATSGAGFVVWRGNRSPGSESASQTKPQTQQPELATRVKIIAAGDFITHDALNLRARRDDASYDYLQFMGAMKPLFEKADVRFCNQAVPSGGTAYGITGYPVFNSPLEIVTNMHDLGCNLINAGTNHSFDKGIKPIDAQLQAWEGQENTLAVAGINRNEAEQTAVRYFSVDDVRFAFLSYVTYTNAPVTIPYAVNMYSEEVATKQITEAREKADVVLVSMRWGTEYSSGINDTQRSIAKKLADLGVDVVLGHGPHVLEPVQRLPAKNGGETIVWYSIGNFLNAQLPIEALTGCLATMTWNIDAKKMESIGCLPIYMHYEWTEEQKAKEELLKRDKFLLVPLDEAEDLLTRSLHKTTVQAQTKRISDILNTYTPVTMLTSATY